MGVQMGICWVFGSAAKQLLQTIEGRGVQKMRFWCGLILPSFFLELPQVVEFKWCARHDSNVRPFGS